MNIFLLAHTFAATNPATSTLIAFPSSPFMEDQIKKFSNIFHQPQVNVNEEDHVYKYPNGSVLELKVVDASEQLRGRYQDYLLITDAGHTSIPPQLVQALEQRTKTLVVTDKQ